MTSQRRSLPAHAYVVVIGAGFSGVGLAISLRRSGFDDFVVLERANDVGGTWRDNTYPGAACDVPSHLYSFSFDLNPNWTKSFSGQDEIQKYITDVTNRNNIREKILFNCAMTSARWDNDTSTWLITTNRGVITSTILVSAVGALCEPHVPAIDGIDDFGGAVFHSSAWDHNHDLAGKRVAVIGTGASAIQIIPAIAPQVAQLDVYQRTPPWLFPKLLRPYSPLERSAFRRWPNLMRLLRSIIYLLREIYAVLLIKFTPAAALLSIIARVKLWLEVPDKDLRRKVTPSYRVGCKRMLISNEYYPALSRDNVELVTEKVQRINASLITSATGKNRRYDIVIVATGFHVADSPAFSLFTGRDGRTLADVYTSVGTKAYKGTAVSGFPNMFIVLGPNSALGYSSAIFMIESQLKYIVDAIHTISLKNISEVEVKLQTQNQYNQDLRRKMSRSVWTTGGCESWFLDDAGDNVALWPDFSFRFRKQLEKFDLDAYDVVRGDMLDRRHTL